MRPIPFADNYRGDVAAANDDLARLGVDRPHLVSVVVPVYRGQQTIGPLVAELHQLTRRTATPDGVTFLVDEIIVVHDHGADLSDVVLQKLQQTYDQVRIVWLSRNFGQDAATIAGMSEASGDWIVTMDEDGQHDPRFIGAFLDTALAERANLVYAKPTNTRPHSLLRNLTSRGSKLVLATVFGLPESTRFESFRLIHGDIGRQLASVAASGVYLDVALSWVVDAVAQVPVVLRAEGRHESGYDYRRLVALFWKMVLCSGTRGLRLVSLLGLTLALAGVGGAAVVVYKALSKRGWAPEGWASIIVVLLVCSGAILFSLGLIAEYLGVALHVLFGKPLYLTVEMPPPRPAAISSEAPTTAASPGATPLSSEPILFSRPYRASRELANLTAALDSDHIHGDGRFTASATAKLKTITGAPHVLLTTSCTSALDITGLLLDLGPDDEVIVPSFAFSSVATAMALRGATCVFADIDSDTGNLDPAAVAALITERTKAIVVIHYGGVAADMEKLLALAVTRGIAIVEDTAHGLGGTWRGHPLGTLGSMGTLSFHDTKNVHCGEGGALLLSDDILMERAEIIREKGTDRVRFRRGEVDKYSWQDLGSSYLLSELNAAVLDAQLDEFATIQTERHRVWDAYAAALPDWARRNDIRLMTVSADREHTAHLYYLRTPTERHRGELIAHLAARGISAPFHYVPLDSSAAGLKLGRTPLPCVRSAEFAATVVRLPLWSGLRNEQVLRVIEAVTVFAV
jgi:dTDP-4-amino-4,6-dideoxygalactose transaminase